MSAKDKIRQSLTGISGILVTPMSDDDVVAPERLKPIVDRAIDAGIHILVANGNTSEFYALTMDEAETMVSAAADHIRKRVPLLAGVGRGIKDACRLAETSVAAGAEALMIHQPPDPFSAPRGFVDYVRTVSAVAPGVPIVLYLRNDAIGQKAIKELCEIDAVIGVKWATPNPKALGSAILDNDPSIVWVGGLAETWAPVFYAVGARGFTSGLINIWPSKSVEIHTALEAGDYAAANSLIAEIDEFEAVRAEELNGTNVTGVKAALRAVGQDCGPARPPSAWPLNGDQQSRLEAFLARNHLVGN